MNLLDYRLDFDSPGFLWLLTLIPVVWALSFKSLAGLGTLRRLAALALRSVVLMLLVFALADLQLVRSTDKLTVVYVLDLSASIPEDQKQMIVRYFNRSVREHRKNEDAAGAVIFGRDAAIEIPPFEDEVQIAQTPESELDPNFTNLVSALKLAQAIFPEDGAKRVVIVSDGNENLFAGEAVKAARDMAVEQGIGIDVVPVRIPQRGEVIVEKVAMPTDVRQGEPFDLTVVLNNVSQPTGENGGKVKGKLVITQKTDDQPVVVSDEPVELEPGKTALSIRQQFDSPAFYTYEARFQPEDAATDNTPQNNAATTFVHVRGEGRVLLIEDDENPNLHTAFIEALARRKIEVVVRKSSSVPTSLLELQPYDAIILANVPREALEDEQIEMLAQNTQHFGSGLVMLGGANSFGAGGWSNTKLEEAMPVDFTIKNAKVKPKGALALIMHASEIAQGNYWQKVVSRESIKALGNDDYCGLLHYSDRSGGAAWLWNHPNGMVTVKGNRDKMLALLDRMSPGDMPDFDPAMRQAAAGFGKLQDAAVKHMIIVSDGDPTPPSAGVITSLKQQKVTVSTVAVGSHGPATSAVLRQIAQQTGGKYYEVTNNRALPRIFQKEARKVAQPLIYDQPPPIALQRRAYEMVSGIDSLPPIAGFVQTQVKENPLVEISLIAERPGPQENRTILAGWQYGLGRSVAFTSDAGAIWTNSWVGTETYEKLFGQMISWAMRPSGDEGKFTVTTDIKDGVGTINVTALDGSDAFLNFLEMQASVVSPDLKSKGIELKQTHAGHYVATFDANQHGSYLISINTGQGKAPIITGANVPYSPEFQYRPMNDELLKELASLKAKNRYQGKLIEDPSGQDDVDKLLETNVFRHDLPRSTSSQDAWFVAVMLATCLFFADVFTRRVTVTLAWLPPLLAKAKAQLLGGDAPVAKPEYMARLRGRKQEVTGEIEQRKAATRFEPSPDQPVESRALEEQLDPQLGAPREKKQAQSMTPQETEESYTDRLLKAKKRVWNDKDK